MGVPTCVCGDGSQSLRGLLWGREFVLTVEFEVLLSLQGRRGQATSTWETGLGWVHFPREMGGELGVNHQYLGEGVEVQRGDGS